MNMSGVPGIGQTRPASPVVTPSGGAERVSPPTLPGLNEGTGIRLEAASAPVDPSTVRNTVASDALDRVGTHSPEGADASK